MINAYLDIDGVILANEKNLANYAKEFIKYLVDNYNVFWLTTHCKGDASVPVERLKPLLDNETLELIKTINPTNWEENKTEGIDFSMPFLWFDDDLWDQERAVLIDHSSLKCWIGIDLSKDPDSLKKLTPN